MRLLSLPRFSPALCPSPLREDRLALYFFLLRSFFVLIGAYISFIAPFRSARTSSFYIVYLHSSFLLRHQPGAQARHVRAPSSAPNTAPITTSMSHTGDARRHAAGAQPAMRRRPRNPCTFHPLRGRGMGATPAPQRPLPRGEPPLPLLRSMGGAVLRFWRM